MEYKIWNIKLHEIKIAFSYRAKYRLADGPDSSLCCELAWVAYTLRLVGFLILRNARNILHCVRKLKDRTLGWSPFAASLIL